MQRLATLYTCIGEILLPLYAKLTYCRPVVFLLLRVLIASVFWKAGLTKLDNWESTISLFEFEYKVPLLPPVIAALMATVAELACPVLLVLGFGTRIAATALLIMTAVIEFTYIHDAQHLFWFGLLGLLLCHGADKLSLDYLVQRNYKKLH